MRETNVMQSGAIQVFGVLVLCWCGGEAEGSEDRQYRNVEDS